MLGICFLFGFCAVFYGEKMRHHGLDYGVRNTFFGVAGRQRARRKRDAVLVWVEVRHFDQWGDVHFSADWTIDVGRLLFCGEKMRYYRLGYEVRFACLFGGGMGCYWLHPRWGADWDNVFYPRLHRGLRTFHPSGVTFYFIYQVWRSAFQGDTEGRCANFRASGSSIH